MDRFAHFTTHLKLDLNQSVDTRTWPCTHYWSSRFNDNCEELLVDIVLKNADPNDIKTQITRELFEKVLHIFSKPKLGLLKELIFEEVRNLEFSNKPSRRNCIFLLDETIADSSIDFFGSVFSQREKYILEKDKTSLIHLGDAKLLNCNNASISEIYDFARKYWKSETSEAPVLEVLGSGIFRRVG